MAAVIHQDDSGLHLSIPEVNRLDFSYDIQGHATKSWHLSPREKITLEFDDLVVPESQSREKVYKKSFKITAKMLETDIVAFQQLLYYAQSPPQAWLTMAGGEIYSFVANSTANADQVQGSATGTSLGSLQWKFVCNEKERYFEITYSGEMSLVEYRFLMASRAAALTGVATPVKSAGTLAHMTNGEASYRDPGFIGVAITNTGGTALGGKLGDVTSFTLQTMGTKVKDEITWGQRVVVECNIDFYGVTINDFLAFHDDELENVKYQFNDRNGLNFLLSYVATPKYKITIGDGDNEYKISATVKGHAVMNPNDAATPPTNIDAFITDPLQFVMNLANN